MSVVSLRQAEIPGIRPLYADLLYNFSGVEAFYPHPPSLEAARIAARGVRLENSHRRSLVDELSRQNEGCGAATLANLDRLADPSTVVVATGQQVGMFGGPIFTLYKALTAVKCAAELTRRGTPAVPVFWLATEDHDVEEVNHSWTMSASGAPIRLEAVTQGETGAAVGDIRVVDFRLGAFEELCAEMPFALQAVALARDTYGSAFGFGDAFRALYRNLLAPYGIVFLCPMQRGIRRLAAPLLRRAIERAPQLTDALLQRGLTLQAAGYHQQVHVQASTSLVLLFEDSARVALKRQNGVYWAHSRAYTPQELLVRVDSTPLEVSPSALLRPVMQDFLLPTAALVAGPSEAAYLGQASVLYESLLGRMPAVLPRATSHGPRRCLEQAPEAVRLGGYGLSGPATSAQGRDRDGDCAASAPGAGCSRSATGSRTPCSGSRRRYGTSIPPWRQASVCRDRRSIISWTRFSTKWPGRRCGVARPRSDKPPGSPISCTPISTSRSASTARCRCWRDSGRRSSNGSSRRSSRSAQTTEFWSSSCSATPGARARMALSCSVPSVTGGSRLLSGARR